MATTAAAGDIALRVARTFRASTERVFQAWTAPEELKKWSAPGEAKVGAVEVDLRVGGAYRIRMEGPDGSVHVAAGEYLDIDAPRRLVYTWRWEKQPEGQKDPHAQARGTRDTVVTVEFFERPGGTEVVLTHSGFETEESRAGHGQGWDGCLEKLGKLLGT
jgi:uncharacterized protein YndB with AHSA1/START domain